MDENRLKLLLGYLEQDPENVSLIEDAALAAMALAEDDKAVMLFERLEKLHPLTPSLRNDYGLSALRLSDFDTAERLFQTLVGDDEADPAARFNLAWAQAKQGKLIKAEQQINEACANALPQAAMLKIQLIHQRGAFDEALEMGRELLTLHPDHAGLNAAMSVLALDCEDTALAKHCADKASGHPDGLTSLATLELRDMAVDEAAAHFDAALALNSHSPRAWVGSGLVELMRNNPQIAAGHIDRGAEQFGDHIGSWIAAGWAYLLAGRHDIAEQRFEAALGVDENFAESHGSLAVSALLKGDTSKAQKLADIASRLDRNCFSAALAQSLIANSSGDTDKARKILERALNTPMDDDGRTVAQALIHLGL
jgi:tetratricopeptide (TPR) repeat protein